MERQGRDDGIITRGVMHPNKTGHKAMAIQMANAAFGRTFEEGTDPAPHIKRSTVQPEVDSAPPTGAEWAVQSIDIDFNKGVDPATLGVDDVSITAPDGTPVVVRSVQPARSQPSRESFGDQEIYVERCVPPQAHTPPELTVGVSRFQITFPPVAYGSYSLSIGPEVRDARGRAADYDGDGISAYRSGSVERDTYISDFVIAQPGDPMRNLPAPEPITPAVDVDDDGSTIGSITQYSTTANPSWFATAPLDPNQSIAYSPGSPSLRPGEIDFIVATINTYLRNSSFEELYNTNTAIAVTLIGAGIGTVVGAGVGGIFGGAAAGAAIGGGLGASALVAGQIIYDELVSNSSADNWERAKLIRDEFLDFDIVAMQELFDPDQVDQLGDYAAEKGSYQLRGPRRDSFGKWPFRFKAGADAGLSLFVKGDLSDQVPPPPRDFFEYLEWKEDLDDQYDHDGVPFTQEGSTRGADWLANKGFTLDRIQLGTDKRHFIYVVNTHMNSQKDPSFRQYQIRQLNE